MAAPSSRRPVPSAFITQTCVSSIVVSRSVRPRRVRQERDALAVRRPARLVFRALRGGQSPDLSVGDAQREEIRVVEEIRLGLAVGDEQDLAAVRRPVDRVLLERARRERARRAARRVHHEDVAAPVVVEARVPFHGVGLVEVARDHDGIAAGQLRLRAGRGGDERDPLASPATRRSARPSKVSGLFVPAISASARGRAAVRARRPSARLCRRRPRTRSTGRPATRRDRTPSPPAPPTCAGAPSGSAITQSCVRGPAGTVVGLHGVGGARAVRRELDGRDRAHPVVVGALQAPGRGQGGRGGEGEDARESGPTGSCGSLQREAEHTKVSARAKGKGGILPPLYGSRPGGGSPRAPAPRRRTGSRRHHPAELGRHLDAPRVHQRPRLRRHQHPHVARLRDALAVRDALGRHPPRQHVRRSSCSSRARPAPGRSSRA